MPAVWGDRVMNDPSRSLPAQESHVDLFAIDWLASRPGLRFVRQLALDDPLLVRPDGGPTQLAEGRATYMSVSEPHTNEECPHAVLSRVPVSGRPRDVHPIRWFFIRAWRTLTWDDWSWRFPPRRWEDE